MLTLSLVLFFAILLLNYYTIIFGKKDLEQLKSKVSLGKYLKEIDDVLTSSVGKRGNAALKLSLVIIGILLIIHHVLLLLAGVAMVVLATVVAKKSYQIGAISNVLNKIATYINRVR